MCGESVNVCALLSKGGGVYRLAVPAVCKDMYMRITYTPTLVTRQTSEHRRQTAPGWIDDEKSEYSNDAYWTAQWDHRTQKHKHRRMLA